MKKFLGCPCKSLGAAEIEGKIDGPVLPPSLLVSINNYCTVPLGMPLHVMINFLSLNYKLICQNPLFCASSMMPSDLNLMNIN